MPARELLKKDLLVRGVFDQEQGVALLRHSTGTAKLLHSNASTSNETVLPSSRSREKLQSAIMIEVVVNDRLGRKVRVKCEPDDTIGDLKKLIAAQTGTRPEKLKLQKWNIVFRDHITLADYEIQDGTGLELFYQ